MKTMNIYVKHFKIETISPQIINADFCCRTNSGVELSYAGRIHSFTINFNQQRAIDFAHNECPAIPTDFNSWRVGFNGDGDFTYLRLNSDKWGSITIEITP